MPMKRLHSLPGRPSPHKQGYSRGSGDPDRRDSSPRFHRGMPDSRGTDGIRSFLKLFWRGVRRLSGDDAYERYLEHHTIHHADATPLTRAEFFRRWQEEKWSGTRRCC